MGKIYSAIIGKNTRVYLTDTTDMVEEARLIHNTLPVSTAALGRVLTAASLMGKMLKGDKEKLTFQIRGSNLIRSIVAVSWPNADVKAYISDPQIDLPDHDNGKLNVGGAVGAEGELIIIRDLGLKEPYIGQAKLVSGEIAEDLANYYVQSEQQPSIVSLGVLVGSDLTVKAAGGMIAQTMPDIDDEELTMLEKALESMPAISSLVGMNLSPVEILNHMFPDMPVNITGESENHLKCDCSKEKLEKALISIGVSDIEEILREDGQATLTCHFCNESYVFDKSDLEHILEEIIKS